MMKLLLSLPLFVLLAASLASYGQDSYRYSEIKPKSIRDFDLGYREYCNLDLTANFELNAVQCSFYGDYQNALDQATERETVAHSLGENIVYDHGGKAQLIEQLKTALQDSTVDKNQKVVLQKLLDEAAAPPVEEVFAQAKPLSAVGFIVDNAKNYHFTLINEAHYNSQNRAFTQTLLRPLWDVGYRYLALEVLGYEDTNLHERGYPTTATGYYIRDSNFGNLVREALALGYQMVTYETQNSHDGTLRDQDQANNIYEQTWKKDRRGKVLIHAGYSHIYESGSANYEPMGYQLKNLTKQDILTIDQEEMIGFTDSVKQHPYYQAAFKQFGLAEPTVFLDEHNEVIVNPIQSLGIDIQVYHPKTRFEHGRPTWMKRKDIRQVPLPAKLLKYEGNLIQAVVKGEDTEAIPADQFVISEEKTFLLKSGSYDLRIINCEGTLVGILALEVD